MQALLPHDLFLAGQQDDLVTQAIVLQSLEQYRRVCEHADKLAHGPLKVITVSRPLR